MPRRSGITRLSCAPLLPTGAAARRQPFYNDIKDAQRPQTIRAELPDGSPFFTTDFANAPAAESYGLELELGWRPSEQLLRAGLGLLETEIRRTLLARDPSSARISSGLAGLQRGGSVDWRPIEPLRLSAQLRHNGGYFSDDANSPALRDRWRRPCSTRAPPIRRAP